MYWQVMKMSDGTYQELAWLYDVYNNEEYPNEVKIFLELFDTILQDRDISAHAYTNKYMDGVVKSSSLLKNLRYGALPPLYCIKYFDFLEDSEIDYLEWFMVNKEHITRKKYRKHNVDDIFDKWEGKPCPETVTRFTQQEENKAVRRLRRKHQAIKYLQLAYKLGV